MGKWDAMVWIVLFIVIGVGVIAYSFEGCEKQKVALVEKQIELEKLKQRNLELKQNIEETKEKNNVDEK